MNLQFSINLCLWQFDFQTQPETLRRLRKTFSFPTNSLHLPCPQTSQTHSLSCIFYLSSTTTPPKCQSQMRESSLTWPSPITSQPVTQTLTSLTSEGLSKLFSSPAQSFHHVLPRSQQQLSNWSSQEGLVTVPWFSLHISAH